MKTRALITLILFLSLKSIAQLDHCFTVEEVRLINKQQIRLIYCDSFKLVLNDKLDNCQQQNEVLTKKIDRYKNTSIANEAIIGQYKEQYNLDQKTIKQLTRRNRRLKFGIIGVGVLSGSLLIYSAIK